MTIDVTSNGDGTYSVTCGGTTVTVGSPSGARNPHEPDTGPVAGPVIWPIDPDENPGGVRAYMIVEPFDATMRPEQRVGFHFDSPDGLAQSITEHVQQHPVDWTDRHMETRVLMEPGRSFDVDTLLGRMGEVADELGSTAITLRITSLPGNE